MLNHKSLLPQMTGLILVLLFLVACGKPKPVPLSAIQEAMAPLASGDGILEAARYNDEVPGPHRLVILTDTGSPHEWNELLPTSWIPSSASDTELVFLVFPEREIELDTQQYYFGEAITRFRYVMEVHGIEAQTGDTLWTGFVSGSKPEPFPEIAPADKTRIEGGHVSYAEFEEWLVCRVTPQQCDVRTLDDYNKHVTSIAFSPDGHTLASGSYDELTRNATLSLWRISDGVLLRVLEGHTGEVNSVAFSPDGQILASGSMDEQIHLWQISDGNLLHILEGHRSIVTSVAFSPDGQIIASGSMDKTIHLWQVSDGDLLRMFEGHTGGVTSVAFSPDGQTLASGSRDGTVRLWQVYNGALLRLLEGHTGDVNSVAFSPDGQTLASGSNDGTVRLWPVSDGALLRILEGHTGIVNIVSFSPDGQTLATGSTDDTVRLWHVSDGTQKQIMDVFTGNVTSVVFSPDGQILASGSLFTVYLWRIR